MGAKHCRKLYGKNDRWGQLPHLRSISERPEIVAQRLRLGDWEADTMVGQGYQQAIVSLTERKSKFTLLRKVARAMAPAVRAAMLEL